MTERITRDEYGLALADAASKRADCTRRQVGAVIVAADGSIVSTGYNGLPSGRPGCLTAGACPRGQMSYPDAQPYKVGDPDPTPSDAMEIDAWCIEPHGIWVCSLEKNHDGAWHIAGDGDEVCDIWPVAGATQPASIGYEETGCRAVHAEVNAIIRAGRERCLGSTIYVSQEPCFHCSVVIEGAGLARVVTPTSESRFAGPESERINLWSLA